MLEYFGAIALTVLGLMVYNLLKMFGLDVIITNTQRDFVEWFTDTSAVVNVVIDGNTSSEFNND